MQVTSSKTERSIMILKDKIYNCFFFFGGGGGRGGGERLFEILLFIFFMFHDESHLCIHLWIPFLLSFFFFFLLRLILFLSLFSLF